MARKSRKRNRTVKTQHPKTEPVSAAYSDCETSGHETSGPAPETDAVETGVRKTESIAAEHQPPAQVIEAVETNTQLLRELMDQIAQLGPASTPSPIESDLDSSNELHQQSHDSISIDSQEVLEELNAAANEISELRHGNEELHAELSRCNGSITDLESQNRDLADQIGTLKLRQTVSTTESSTADALSWEERRELIIQQMEADTFDADEFVEQLGKEKNRGDTPHEVTPQTPLEYVNELATRLAKAESDVVHREGEVHELRILLQDQSEVRGSDVVVGAAAIAQMVDSDELVLAERDRLQQLQAQWEEKFRQSEIDASLERAKLSRERQELSKRSSELEEQIAHIQREAKESEEFGENPSRRWLAKLGLTDDSK